MDADRNITRAESRNFHIVSLGCARNRVDSEVMLGSMIDRGWEHTEDADKAQAIIINTCGFIEPSKIESVDTILEATERKKQNAELKVIVAGCLTQRYKSQLKSGLPEVDLFLGTDEFPKLAELLEQGHDKGAVFAGRSHYLFDGELPKVNTLSPSSAYVKVAEGCQHNCAFCIIPAIRGRLRSRPVSGILSEASKLVHGGVKEINLIAQDLAAYGRDLGEDRLLPLLRELVGVQGLDWVRLLYMYPENIGTEFLEFFAGEAKLAKYLDIPIQHADDEILRRMNRMVTREELEATLAKVRRFVPGIHIRTSVMVGFPGETESQFESLLEFIEEQKFEHLGCFTFSREHGTVAGRMKDQIDDELKKHRQQLVMERQREISQAHQKAKIGTIMPVLIEGVSEESDLLLAGRHQGQAPEVDGIVYINDGDARLGLIQNVQITEAHAYDLVGRVIS